MTTGWHRAAGIVICAAAFALPVAASEAVVTADAPENVTATLNALDKITGRVSQVKARAGQPVYFGSLEITLRTCQSSPPEEAPETKAFLEVRDLRAKDGTRARDNAKLLFSGWMFASSPALNALEHPVYDVWVIACSAVAPSTLDLVPAMQPAEPVAEPDTAPEDTDAGMPQDGAEEEPASSDSLENPASD